MNIDFAFEALRKLVIFRYGGFEFTVSDKWLQKTKKGRMQENKLQPYNNCSRNDVSASAEDAHTVRCFWRKCSAVFDKNDLSGRKQNRASHSVPVLQCVCMIENVSSRTLLTRWMTEEVSFDTLVLVDWWCIRKKSGQKSEEYRHRLFGVLTEVFGGRQVW